MMFVWNILNRYTTWNYFCDGGFSKTQCIFMRSGLKYARFLCDFSLHWHHNDHDGVSNYQPHGCLLNRSFGRRSKKTSKLRVTGLRAGNSPGPVNSPHKGPVTRKMFPFDDVIMFCWFPFFRMDITCNASLTPRYSHLRHVRKWIYRSIHSCWEGLEKPEWIYGLPRRVWVPR